MIKDIIQCIGYGLLMSAGSAPEEMGVSLENSAVLSSELWAPNVHTFRNTR